MKLPLIQTCLSAILIRILIFGASIGDAVGLAALAALYGFYLYMEHLKATPVDQEWKDRLIALEEKASSTENKVGALGLRR